MSGQFLTRKLSPDNKSLHVSDYKTTHANKFLVKKQKIINKSILEIYSFQDNAKN